MAVCCSFYCASVCFLGLTWGLGGGLNLRAKRQGGVLSFSFSVTINWPLLCSISTRNSLVETDTFGIFCSALCCRWSEIDKHWVFILESLIPLKINNTSIKKLPLFLHHDDYFLNMCLICYFLSYAGFLLLGWTERLFIICPWSWSSVWCFRGYRFCSHTSR